ncbi:hypothetical protein D9619_002085 [Psilocybe cf. subviscida]|uniref:Uncharacterized protein n=1 Tax=Psilocybe cf. subviscida TaxID=2480587 RepID=A0A8H5BEU8_9AGAR|nr:hypothetical protein D9619_002085 [Psilocybe cf. subviscida]
MVILDEEAANERSPLKSPHTQLAPPPQGAAPPPYAASTSLPPAGYVHGHHAAHVHPQAAHTHQESPALLIRRDTPGQRFLKAFLCALFVLFLWSVFLDTLSLLSTPHNHREGSYYKDYPWRERLLGNVTTPAPCPCATPDPIRILPIQYPPSGLASVRSAPTNTVPCATAIP